MNRLKVPVFLCMFLTTLFLSAPSTLAADLTVNPGMWETVMTTTNSMMPEPTVNTSQSCVKDAVFHPEDMLDGVEHCQMTENKVADNRLTFAMTCTMHGTQTNVKGNYQGGEDQGEGEMAMDLSMGPMKMNVNLNWMSRRIGDC